MINMTKRDLKPGMFGKDSDGDLFVVVGDKLIYENGLFDDVSDMTDTMEFPNGANISELYEANCFEAVKDCTANLIWKRPEKVEPKAKAEEAKITITEEEFSIAIAKANDTFMEIGKDKLDDGLMMAMMSMQNMAFGTLLGAVLFDKEIK